MSPAGEVLANMASGMVAKPISDIAGMAAIPMNMMGMDRDPGAVRDQVANALTYQPRSEDAQTVAKYNPLALVGRLFSNAGDMTKSAVAPTGTSGPVQDAAGNAIAEAVRQLPAILPLGAKAAAPGTQSALKGTARSWMSSALKPNQYELRTGKGPRAVDTLLNEGINVSRGGVDTLRGAIDDLNSQIADKISSSTATIDKARVTAPIDEAIGKFTEQVNPNADVSALTRARNEFLNHPSLPSVTPARTVQSPVLDSRGVPFTTEIPASGTNAVPVQTAQELKQGTYRALGNKAYGELKGAEIEGQKALARGLKDEIADAVPEVRPLNAKESELLNALPIVERRVLMEANKNPGGLAWLAKNPAAWAAFIADRSAPFKSIVARMLNTASEAVPGAAEAAPAIGAIVQGYRFKGGNPNDQSSWEPVQQ